MSGPDPGRLLGERAVERGWLTANSLGMALASLERRVAGGERVFLGRHLVELGLLDAGQVRQLVAEQEKEVLVCSSSGCGRRYNIRGYRSDRTYRCKACGARLAHPRDVDEAVLEVEAEAGQSAATLLVVGGSPSELAATQIGPASAETAPTRLDRTSKDLEGVARLFGAPALGGSGSFGRFLEVSEIARGGMGAIYRAIDPELGRPVAIKVILSGGGASDEEVRRFLREAQITGQLQHPGIPPVFELSRAPDGRTYFAMKLIDGRSLADSLVEILSGGIAALAAERRRLLSAMVKVCEALAYAHSRGVVHRDLKPANIMLGHFGEVLVMDWGIAKILGTSDVVVPSTVRAAPGESDTVRTLDGAVLGTAAYMSVEQADGRQEDVGPRSDVYSLGVILYQILTGTLPYGGRSLYEVIAKIQKGRFEPPSRRAPEAGIPAELDQLVARAMNPLPARRYRSVSDLQGAIEAHLEGRTITGVRYSALQRLGKWVRRHRTAVTISAAAASILVGVLGTLGAIWYRTPGSLVLDVAPAGATIRIGEETWTAGPDRLALDLPAGEYEVEFESADHESTRREVVVHRGETKELVVRLDHDQGFLEVEVEPGEAVVHVDGRRYGSRIEGLPFDTGHRRIEYRAKGYFVQRTGVDLTEGATVPLFAWLDPGLIWEYRSAGLHSTVDWTLVGDLDEDGVPEVAASQLGQIVFLSGRTGRVVGEYRGRGFRPDAANEVFALGGEVGRALCVVEGGGPEDYWITLVDRTVASTREMRWSWRGPAGGSPAIWPVPDQDGDGVGEVAVCELSGSVRILSGAGGNLIRSLDRPGADPWTLRPGLVTCSTSGRTRFVLMGSISGAGGEYVIESLRAEDGGSDWRIRTRAVAVKFGTASDGSARTVWIQSRTTAQLRDLTDGSLLWEIPLGPDSGPAAGFNRLDLDGDGEDRELLVEFLGTGVAAYSIDEGRAWWTIPGEMANFGEGTFATMAGGGSVFCAFRERAVLLDGRTGRELRAWSGLARGALAHDVDGDGADEILFGLEGRGILCIDPEGNELWELSHPSGYSPSEIVPDLDGDGLPEIFIVRRSAMLARIRLPRFLWSRRAEGPLQATPLAVALDGDGRLEVVQLGSWADGSEIRAFDGSTGRVLWDRRETLNINRTAGVGDLDADGAPEIVYAARIDWSGASHSVLLSIGSGGAAIVRHALGWHIDQYCVPAVADLDGDGTPDVATSSWKPAEVFAVSGATGAVLWRFPTDEPNMGGVGAADLDGDGLPDVVAPSQDGRLYALRGRDGAVLWKLAIGQAGSRSPPALYDLTGDGTLDVLLVTRLGVLCIVDGASGRLVWHHKDWGEEPPSPADAFEGLGRPVVIELPEVGPTILASMGAAGVVAIDWRNRSVLWRGAARKHVLPTPVAADLDRDGRLEVLVGTGDGELHVLDAATGRTLWRVDLAEKQIEADPTPADLDGDGLLDVLVADHDFNLHAIDGRAIAPGLRRR